MYYGARGIVGLVKPTYRPGSMESFIKLMPEGVGFIVGDVASERALWQLVEMPRESRLDEGAQSGKRVLGSNVP